MKKLMKPFSLLEVLSVMGLILVLIAWMVPAIGPMLTKARKGQIMASIRGQLEVAHSIAFDGKTMTRVVFSYDPKGAIIRDEYFKNAVDINGNANSDALALIGGSVPVADINGDGVANQDASATYFWIQCYLCGDKTTASVSTMKATYAASLSVPETNDVIASKYISGPYWMRRPVARRKIGTAYQKTYMNSESMRVLDPDTGTAYYFRPVKNKGMDADSDLFTSAEVMSVDANGNCFLMNDSGGEIDITLLEDEAEGATGAWWNTYLNSVAIYPTRKGIRYKLIYGEQAKIIADAKYATIEAAEKAKNGGSLTAGMKDSLYADYGYATDITWYLQVIGASYMTGNDDEDTQTDEGMTVSTQKYQQFEKNWTIRVPTYVVADRSDPTNPRSFSGGTPNKTSVVGYAPYFNGLPDPTRKINVEHFLGGEDQSGVMLRRVWAVPDKSNKPYLVYRDDKAVVIEVGSPLKNLKSMVISPFYFYVVFDNKNGVTGMSIGSSFGTVEAAILYFQIANDDGDVAGFIQLQNGDIVEGEFDNLGLVKSDFPNYFEGGRE